jgi:metal-responsive CopG/Arc/MetJ family transcriptional regulator
MSSQQYRVVKTVSIPLKLMEKVEAHLNQQEKSNFSKLVQVALAAYINDYSLNI